MSESPAQLPPELAGRREQKRKKSVGQKTTLEKSTMEKYISGHWQRVVETSVAIAKELGRPQDRTEKMRLAWLILDIGKIVENPQLD